MTIAFNGILVNEEWAQQVKLKYLIFITWLQTLKKEQRDKSMKVQESNFGKKRDNSFWCLNQNQKCHYFATYVQDLNLTTKKQSGI